MIICICGFGCASLFTTSCCSYWWRCTSIGHGPASGLSPPTFRRFISASSSWRQWSSWRRSVVLANLSWALLMGYGCLSETLQSGTTQHFSNQPAQAKHLNNDITQHHNARILPPRRPMRAMSVVLESSHRALSIRHVLSLIRRLWFNRLGQKRV